MQNFLENQLTDGGENISLMRWLLDWFGSG
jgi:hypothetical protein